MQKICVCIKPVPSAKDWDRIKIDPVTKSLVRQGIEQVVNPVDRNALELALSFKEQFGCQIIVFSMAPPTAQETMLEALAMGADEAYLLSDRAFAGGDTLATAQVLAAAIKKHGPFDLIITGDKSQDGGTGHVPSQVAELLGIAHVRQAVSCRISENLLVEAKSKVEDGLQLWQGPLPLLVAVGSKINNPRYTTLKGVLAAKRKPLVVWGLAELGLDPAACGLAGSPTQPGDLFAPEYSRRGQPIEGDVEQIVAQIQKIIGDAGIAL